ncbi:DUF1761 domain-containing protein [Sphingomicrobium lutaoense]|uniref:DUF1761 domain-containing protein n=1 Tax=Sphingomicrobium lutaoense TaxID=515949 RepID=A0A839YZF6_9SPHN|nr:DUF1761 domain-containing protein [Sphingomicrobium lutaoense]MBB3764509.1 hypothetical protein [Sphingomicrobium lutaoense]
MDINWIAVLVAAVSAFVLGGIWYGPIFGKTWMGLVGVTEESMKEANMGKIYGTAFLLNLVAVAAFAMFLGDVDPATGAMYGFVAGLGWVATSFGISYLFEGRPLGLWLVNGGYHTLQFTLFGLILGLF